MQLGQPKNVVNVTLLFLQCIYSSIMMAEDLSADSAQSEIFATHEKDLW